MSFKSSIIKFNTTKFSTIAALGLALTIATPSLAAIEIDEQDFGPSYETMVVDTVVSKPLQLVNAIVGTAAYVVSLPFSIAGGNSDMAAQKMVAEPWEAMNRCLGCTVAEDNYYKLQVETDNQIRIIVDQPSEILINTNDNVIVLPE